MEPRARTASESTRWEVKQRRHVRRFNDLHLHQLIRDGVFTGAELVRPMPGKGGAAGSEVAWRRLYQTAPFREALPSDQPPRTVALRRASKWLGLHVLLFVVVNAAASISGFLIAAWGGLLGFHFIHQGPDLWAVWKGPGGEVIEDRRASGQEDSALVATVVGLREGLGADEHALAGALDELIAMVRSVEHRIETLSGLVAASDREVLVSQYEGLLEISVADMSQAQQALHVQELSSLSARVAALEQVSEELESLEGQRRALVHQVEGLRLLVVGRTGTDGADGDVLAHIQALQGRLAAEREVESSLRDGLS